MGLKKLMNPILPANVELIIKELSQNGHEAYIVGGCVRDMIMGIVPHDYDIATSALPEEVKSIFKKTADTGIKHGTVTVIIENTPYEVTTFRSEFNYSDSRHPDNVKFLKNIEEDLKRRDFTMNAIAFNAKKGFCDPFGGISDINNKTIRAVGDPTERFKEDALRILRLYRFKSTLDFEAEKKTEEASLKLCEKISSISKERIFCELIKTLMGKNPEALEPLINNCGFKFIGINSFKNPENISSLPLLAELRFYAFLKICGADIFSVSRSLKISNKYISDFKDFELLDNGLDKSNIKLYLRRLKNKDNFNLFLIYKKCILKEDITALKKEYNRIIKEKEPYKLKDLEIDGDDLKNIGLCGKEIGKSLNFLLEKVIEDPKLNKKEKLLEIIKSG